MLHNHYLDGIVFLHGKVLYVLFLCSELNDNAVGDSIDGDIPELLRSILVRDPHTFKNGSGDKGKK